MLVLKRNRDEAVVLTMPDGRRIVVTVVGFRDGGVRLGFAAPDDVSVHRDEVQARLDCGERGRG